MKRPLLLTGFMATGKSVVGRALGAALGVPFVDLDAAIEERAGIPISRIFESQGEPEFRALERRVLEETLASFGERPAIVALGGGALLDREFRIDVLSRAIVVTLAATEAEILRRAADQTGAQAARPLLAGAAPAGPDPGARVATLLAARQLGYRESHGQIDTTGRGVAEVAERVRALWERDAVALAAGDSSYVVSVGAGVVAAELPALVDAGGRPSGTVLVSDTNVAPLHGAPALGVLSTLGGKVAEVLLTPGEEHKTLDGLRSIYEGALSISLDRGGLFVGLGGGVVTDMTGFAAATWVRGVRWLALPTTLLAMVDASVGGKTAVDFRAAKNSVGAFWQPSGVICDVTALATETPRMFTGALSEVVKTAVIGDPGLLSLLEDRADRLLAREPDLLREVVRRSVVVKARIVALDEREQGLRRALNLGHTIGHALESAGGYRALTHGEAVSLGLVAALRFGERLGRTPRELTERVVRLLSRLGLPAELDRAALSRATSLLGLDKKRLGDSVRFVFAEDVGRVTSEKIPLSTLVRAAPELADSGP